MMIVAALARLPRSSTCTMTGRHVYAIGGNKEASRAAGIRIRRIVIGAFIVNGLLVGLAGRARGELLRLARPDLRQRLRAAGDHRR